MKTITRPTMKDVARISGVAESTVSRVINGTKAIGPETRAKVEKALRDLNFHRDSHARRLARGRSDFLGLIISNIENPFYPGLIRSFETAALASGYEVLLCTTNYDPVRTDQAFRKMIENKCPGVAVMTSRVDPTMAERLAERGVASVFLDGGPPGRLRSNLRLDYATGAAEAVRALYTLGHRRFALIAGPQNRASHVAYRRAVEAAVKQLRQRVTVIEGNNDAESGAAAVTTLLASGELPTAVLCSNDITAFGAIRALSQNGLRVPADLSVVGADDIPFAALASPSLSTVHMPREQLGLQALTLLRAMLDHARAPGAECLLPTSLVLRESTGPAPKPG
ncbi:MAG: LacI family DNA-binding transcriptional regulator [Opitutaceae bacterium]|nr:LacI family DNA-binding transcriptional regulator [Opitutaceae bacterium]